MIGIEWLDADGLAGLAPAPGAFARVLVCDLDDPALETHRATPMTDDDLRDEARPGASDRRFFRARRVVLRAFAATCVGVDARDIVIGYDGPGAPRARRPGVFVSAAGRGRVAALAVASAPVGVDVEPCTPAPAPVPEVLHPMERMALESAPEDLRNALFLRFWCAKEAYLKALGEGLTRDPASVAVTLRARDFIVRGAPALAASGLHMASPGGVAHLAACALLRHG